MCFDLKVDASSTDVAQPNSVRIVATLGLSERRVVPRATGRSGSDVTRLPDACRISRSVTRSKGKHVASRTRADAVDAFTKPLHDGLPKLIAPHTARLGSCCSA
jgi:hypothetical protein